MATHQVCVAAQEAGVFFWVIGLQRVEVRSKRHLGIDNDMAATSQLDNHVWANDATTQRSRNLAVKVHMFGHAAYFNHPLQLHLAPTTAGIGRAQGTNKFVSAFSQTRGGTGYRLDLARKGSEQRGAVFLNFLELKPQAVHGLFQRLELSLATLRFLQRAVFGTWRRTSSGVGMGQPTHYRAEGEADKK